MNEVTDTTISSLANTHALSIGAANLSDVSSLAGVRIDDVFVYRATLSTVEVNAVLSGCTYPMVGQECSECPILGSTFITDNFQVRALTPI